MPLVRLRFLSSLFAVALLVPPPASAFDSPLSDTAVREAYFLGQRHDESLARFFEKYTKRLPPAKSAAYLSSVAFFTPFALVAELSSRQPDGYSAQQAQIDHRSRGEVVRVVVQLEFSAGYTMRSAAFWKDFDVQVFDKDDAIKSSDSSVEPNYLCSDEGGCILTGATLRFDFPPESFRSDTANVQITPPQGDPLTVDFDLSSFR
jgi:hypothetical protein